MSETLEKNLFPMSKALSSGDLMLSISCGIFYRRIRISVAK